MPVKSKSKSRPRVLSTVPLLPPLSVFALNVSRKSYIISVQVIVQASGKDIRNMPSDVNSRGGVLIVPGGGPVIQDIVGSDEQSRAEIGPSRSRLKNSQHSSRNASRKFTYSGKSKSSIGMYGLTSDGPRSPIVSMSNW